MTDLLERGSAWLEDQRTRHLSRTVTYLRGGDRVDLPAMIGRTEFERADEYGVVHRTESRDFLVLAAARRSWSGGAGRHAPVNARPAGGREARGSRSGA